MLNDEHLKELFDHLTPEDIFPNTNIRGGVCYFLWDKNYDNSKDLTRVVTYENNKIIADVVRPMRVDGTDIFIRDGKAVNILRRIFLNNDTPVIADHISVRKPFGLESNFIKTTDFHEKKEGLTDPVKCYGRAKTVGYLERNLIRTRSEWINLWKVFTPRANNIGTELNDDNLNTFVGEPGTICTESYIVIGADLNLNRDSADNISKYLTTKFARYTHSLGKASQDATSKTYRFVPLQDFTRESDIDWSKSITEIDKQLYKKYGLSQDEANYIENKIKEMD